MLLTWPARFAKLKKKDESGEDLTQAVKIITAKKQKGTEKWKVISQEYSLTLILDHGKSSFTIIKFLSKSQSTFIYHN